MTTLSAGSVCGVATTSTTAPVVIESADALTIGMALEPAHVMGIHVESLVGCSTLPSAMSQV